MRRRRASIKVLQCHAVALDDEDDDEDGDDDDDDDDGQATSMACQAREYGDWMCHTRRVVWRLDMSYQESCKHLMSTRHKSTRRRPHETRARDDDDQMLARWCNTGPLNVRGIVAYEPR